MSVRHPRPLDDDPRDPEYRGHTEDRDDFDARPDVSDPDARLESFDASETASEGAPNDVLAEERPPAEG